ncbi:MAG TPA: CHAT domain-containing protein, partial [Chitinophagales bacterium]|nr:CHAT domain-containing protein [Chitinophagales bacterium]
KDAYIIDGYDLYRHLLLSIVEADLLDGVNRLILIPDGILSRLPFEALPTMVCSPDTRYENIPYLLQQYSVQYHYSATLWANQQAVKQAKQAATTASGFVGFAPVYSDTAHNKSEQDIDSPLPDDFYKKIGIEKPIEQRRIAYSEIPEAVRSVIDGRDFVELPQSEHEVKNVAALFQQQGEPARVLLHQAANLSQFKALAGNYRYLLIAAHADYNGEKPDQTGIIFSPNEGDGNAIFYMGDAYNLRLQADLVVLSCCETGLGKSQNGEGTMALNRGFLYSGAKNVIYTLFKVHDRESSELTTELFRALLSDAEPITALRQAKLRLIQRGLMPNKWAGYVLVGE